MQPLRALTYLAPGLPLALFEAVCARLGEALGRPVTLRSDPRSSGPLEGDHDPFAAGEADLGFLCSPSYLYLCGRAQPSIELVPAAFVFPDPRNGGWPVYFSDVLVRAGDPARSFDDLRGRRWGFNDPCSLSGFFSVLQHLHTLGVRVGPEFFGQRTCTGSHLASLEALRSGAVDAAAVDSNVLLLAGTRAAGLRVLQALGPFPVQPIVVRRELGGLARTVADVLLDTRLELQLVGAVDGPPSPTGDRREALRAPLAFASVGPAAFEEERRALVALGSIPAPAHDPTTPRA